MAVKKKSEEQILFPDIKIDDDITIKPWSFGMLFEISTLLDSVLDKADEKGILNSIVSEEGSVSYITMARIIALASEEVLQIIAVTIDRSYDEIKEYDMAKGIKIALGIYELNKEVIKNALTQNQK